MQILLVPSPKGFEWAYCDSAQTWDAQRRPAALCPGREPLAAGMAKNEVRAEFRDCRQRRATRRTRIVRLAEAGTTTSQTAAISGHAVDRCLADHGGEAPNMSRTIAQAAS